ncbi:hypothetical protein [Streptomyces malaysiensis]
MASVPFSKLNPKTLRAAILKSAQESPDAGSAQSGDLLVTTLSRDHVYPVEAGRVLRIKYSPSREMCVKEVLTDGKVEARDRKRNAEMSDYRGEIRRSLKLYYRIIDTTETDLI